jgi:protein-S-isoprenylcysteine O-methyltransferase Ste14
MVEASRETSLTFRKIAQRIRVPAGFILAPLLIIAAHPTGISLVAGAALAAIGLTIRAWASGHLRKNQELSVAGPYAYTRNPLYLGTFVMATGIAVATGSLWFVALFIAVYLLIYVPVMAAEADYMRELFPDDYELYSQKVPLMFPRLIPYSPRKADNQPGSQDGQPHTARSFDLSLYLRHREYRAAIGIAFVLALLAARYFFRI